MQHPAFVVDTLIFVAFTLTEYEYIVPAINFKALRSVMVTKEDNFKIWTYIKLLSLKFEL